MPGVADLPTTNPSCTIGVVADTHIPDRARALHPNLLPSLREAGVGHILHAGDICAGRVLAELAQVAPVTAVRGNRDIFLRGLRMVEARDFCGVPVALTHGHGGLIPYFLDKAKHILFGYRVDHYVKDLARAGGAAKVVVFGHTHHPTALMYEGKLLFNPGSASAGSFRGRGPSFCLLHIGPGSAVRAEIVTLTGYRLHRGQWQEYFEENER